MNRVQLTKDLRADEGFVKHVYQDSRGYWTIGIGRLIDGRKGGGITLEEARYLLDHDIDDAVRGLDIHMVWWRALVEPAQRALVNMTFQMGLQGVLKFKKMIACLERRDYEGTAVEALDSKWARQTPERAARIAALFREGVE
jgi:lysozyme|tara:strand:+ start:2197 stop:2622 length:426 start_codon:yes stop_codon:yes gene_type:complete